MIKYGYDRTMYLLKTVFSEGYENLEYIYRTIEYLNQNSKSNSLRITGDVLVTNLNKLTQRFTKRKVLQNNRSSFYEKMFENYFNICRNCKHCISSCTWLYLLRRYCRAHQKSKRKSLIQKNSESLGFRNFSSRSQTKYPNRL